MWTLLAFTTYDGRIRPRLYYCADRLTWERYYYCNMRSNYLKWSLSTTIPILQNCSDKIIPAFKIYEIKFWDKSDFFKPALRFTRMFFQYFEDLRSWKFFSLRLVHVFDPWLLLRTIKIAKLSVIHRDEIAHYIILVLTFQIIHPLSIPLFSSLHTEDAFVKSSASALRKSQYYSTVGSVWSF